MHKHGIVVYAYKPSILQNGDRRITNSFLLPLLCHTVAKKPNKGQTVVYRALCLKTQNQTKTKQPTTNVKQYSTWKVLSLLNKNFRSPLQEELSCPKPQQTG